MSSTGFIVPETVVGGVYYRGGSRIFFRRGCTRLLLYFNTNKPHSFCRIPVVLENRRSSQGGGVAHPLHPPPRSASVLGATTGAGLLVIKMNL